MVACPNPDFDTVYDEWLHYNSKEYNGVLKPEISELGSGSDFTTFLYFNELCKYARTAD